MTRALKVQAPERRARLPGCPSHLTPHAAKEWRRVARALYRMGVLTTFDRAALAAYCQAYGRWVEAEERLRETPLLFKTPSGYVQQSPWLGIANKQLELMGRYMVELGMTPASRSRVAIDTVGPGRSLVATEPLEIKTYIVTPGGPGEPPSRQLYEDWLAKHGREDRCHT